MKKEAFIGVVERLILPLFTGSFIMGEEDSTPREGEVAFGSKNTLLIKPAKTDEYRIVLSRSQPFKSLETGLLRMILREINEISELNLSDEDFNRTLQSSAIEKAICASLCDDKEDNVSVMLSIVSELGRWAARTYEGRKIALGIIINQTVDTSSGVNISQIVDKDFFALLSDGKRSYVELDRNGNLLGYVQIDKIRKEPTIAPYEFENLSRYCNENRVGFVLMDTGDILVFKNRQLLFAKRRGIWNAYSHEEVIQLLSAQTSSSLKDIRRSVYYTALDVSFAYTGGCIVYIKKDMAEAALMHINAHDILSKKYYDAKRLIEIEEAGKLYNLQKLSAVQATYDPDYETFLRKQRCYKALALRKIIKDKPFFELSRKLRQELAGMDGAVVVDYDGTIIACGAILKIEAGSEGGGRLAAATNLAKYGIAIKISQDGTMQGFFADKKNGGKLKTLFSMG